MTVGGFRLSALSPLIKYNDQTLPRHRKHCNIAVGREDVRNGRAAGRAGQQHTGLCVLVVLCCPLCFQQHLLSCGDVASFELACLMYFAIA